MTQHHYPKKFERLLYMKLASAMQDVSDYCAENGEDHLAEFFHVKNGLDGLRFYIDGMMEVCEPSFEGKTEARESQVRLAIERAQRRKKRQAAKLKKSK